MASKGATEMGVSAGSLAVARVLSHPMRVAILISMNTPKRRLSPARFARDHGLDNNKAAYHFRVLAAADCIELVDERQVRGATEHIYEPRTRALAWQTEWEALGPVVQQTLLASVAGQGIQMLGRAIDSGTFEALPESHMSWHTMRLDADAFAKAGTIMDRALTELMDLEEEAIERSDPEDLFLGSFWMSLFESPPKSV